MLKKIRIIFAIINFFSLTFFFIDFADILPKQFSVLAKIQFVPALLSLNFLVIAVLLIITFLFGRIYCSVLCPLGVFQDLIAWFAKKIWRKQKYQYRKTNHILRFVVLGSVVIAWIFGYTFMLGLIEPYSAYGRIVTNIFQPIYIVINNILDTIFRYFNINFSYQFLHAKTILIASTFTFITALITLVIIIVFAFFRGRTFCNTICPVGTVLGYFSKLAVFKVRINRDKCNNCGLCAIRCKSLCINSVDGEIDYSRCINCFNCLKTCKKEAIKYEIMTKKNKKSLLYSPKRSLINENTEINENLRNFLVTSVLAGLTVPKIYAQNKTNGLFVQLSNKKEYNASQPIVPPGAGSVENFQKHCTACHLCVSKCRRGVLQPAFMEYGLAGIMQPVMKFGKNSNGGCDYDCTICSEICPTDALRKLTTKEKHLTQVGKVEFFIENCVVYTNGTSCGACSEQCPTQAISMQAYKNGLTIPVVNVDFCVGCGACEYSCPVQPFKAVHIVANLVHQQAKPIDKSENIEIEINDFGF